MDNTQGVAAGGDELTLAGPFHEHFPCSFAYKVVSSVAPDFSRLLVSYRGEDAGEMFVCRAQEGVSGVHCYSPTTARAYHGRIALLPHCRQLSQMQPAAGRGQSAWSLSHFGGNLEYRISKSEWKLPVVVHNRKGYDGHLIVKALKSEFGGGRG